MSMRLDRIVMEHGEGGKLSHELIRDVFLKHVGSPDDVPEDSTVLPGADCIAVTTDGFTVSPHKFKGGDIGKLAVCGTYNDLIVRGAVPKYMTTSFIIEEGLRIDELEEIVGSMAREALASDFRVVAGDTKVVQKGNADKLYIAASGIGFLHQNFRPGVKKVQPHDAIIVTGDIGRHGATILSHRLGLELPDGYGSDCAAMNYLLALFDVEGIHCMRDLTRGGLATVLCEVAEGCGFAIEVVESSIPVDQVTTGISNLLGIDPLYLPCEGRAVIFCDASSQKKTVQSILRAGLSCDIIGTVLPGQASVRLLSRYGGTRRLSMLIGAELPRMC